MAQANYQVDIECGPSLRRLMWHQRFVALGNFAAGALGGLLAYAALRALGF